MDVTALDIGDPPLQGSDQIAGARICLPGHRILLIFLLWMLYVLVLF
jgi:hypothetical protein